MKKTQHELFLALVRQVDKDEFDAVIEKMQPEDFGVNEEIGKSPLLYAAQTNKNPHFDCLLPYSDLAQQDREGNTALMLLINPVASLDPISNESIQRVLNQSVQKGAQNFKNKNGDTALSLAVATKGQGRKCASHWLPQLVSVCDVEWKSKDEDSLLMLAATNNHAEAIELLINRCDPKKKNRRGETALDIAIYMHAWPCVDRLVMAEDPKTANEHLKKYGGTLMPRTQAHLERLELQEATGSGAVLQERPRSVPEAQAESSSVDKNPNQITSSKTPPSRSTEQRQEKRSRIRRV